MFAPDKKTSQALTDSNNLFQKILEDFEEDHDPETGLHRAPTFITNSDLTLPETGKARLQKTGVGQYAFLEEGGTKTFSVAQIPTLQQAYANFNDTGPVNISNQENIASILAPTPGQSIYNVTFSNPLPNASYNVSGWAVAPSPVIVQYQITNQTQNGFTISFLQNGSPVSVISKANFTVFY